MKAPYFMLFRFNSNSNLISLIHQTNDSWKWICCWDYLHGIFDPNMYKVVSYTNGIFPPKHTSLIDKQKTLEQLFTNNFELFL